MDIDLIIRNILEEFVKIDDNIYHSERLFVAHTVLRWAFETTKDENQIKFYVNQIKKYLRGEINIFWKDGKIRISNRG